MSKSFVNVWRVIALCLLVVISAQVHAATSKSAGGAYHSLLLRADGTVWAWGDNSYGQLGDGTVTPSLKPKRVPGIVGVAAIASGLFHGVALTANGTVWTWGVGDHGELGDGTSANRPTPLPVPGLSGVVAVASGDTTLWRSRTTARSSLGAITERANSATAPPPTGPARFWYLDSPMSLP
jgi:alpha-tubulin suppressor-like RCC1 family protein